MTDLYLFATDEADMTTALLLVGVIDDEGNPTQGFLVDQIGPITIWDYSVDPPVETEYPEWHTNLRGDFTDEQLTALEPMRVYPPLPYRVWA